MVNFLQETSPVWWRGTTNKPECRWVDSIFEGRQRRGPVLFARSLRDYFDSCKTACNLTAHRDRVSAGLQCRQEQACLPVKSPSLENTHAYTDMLTQESRHKDAHAHGLWKTLSGLLDCAACSFPLDGSSELSTYAQSLVSNSFEFSLAWQERWKYTRGNTGFRTAMCPNKPFFVGPMTCLSCCAQLFHFFMVISREM